MAAISVITVESGLGVIDIASPPPPVSAVDVAVQGYGTIGYAQLPAGLRVVPIAFLFSGAPAAGASFSVPLGFPVTVPPDLEGFASYAAHAPAAGAAFTLHRVSGGAATLLGTVTFLAGGAVIAAGAGGAVAAGDALRIVAPSPADVALADVGVTILAGRV